MLLRRKAQLYHGARRQGVLLRRARAAQGKGQADFIPSSPSPSRAAIPARPAHTGEGADA